MVGKVRDVSAGVTYDGVREPCHEWKSWKRRNCCLQTTSQLERLLCSVPSVSKRTKAANKAGLRSVAVSLRHHGW